MFFWKKLSTSICLFATTYLEADMSLSNLIEYDKASCLEHLEKATDAELWDALLEGQTKLFFDYESRWIAKEDWWHSAKRVLEIGCGNGAFLSKLATRFPNKTYLGIEKRPLALEQAQERHSKEHIIFSEGDAEVFDPRLIDSADVVFFRLVLQHLNDPILALKHVTQYLSSNGYVIIIDVCDKAKKTSHRITAIEDALALVAEMQEKKGKGNRAITLGLLKTLEDENSTISQLYELVFSNLDAEGNILSEIMRVEGERDRQLYSNNGLLFFTLLNRTYHVPINLDKGYDELKAYHEDEEAWTSMGMHTLILKKK